MRGVMWIELHVWSNVDRVPCVERCGLSSMRGAMWIELHAWSDVD